MVNAETTLPLGENFYVGIDAGGTKVNILDSVSSNLHRFNTIDYENFDSLLHEYFEKLGSVPLRTVIAMAGPRDDETGAVKMTNCPWPTFYPQETARRYPGAEFSTVNDMVATAAGVVLNNSVSLQLLKEGRASATGNKVAAAISTGVNACPAVWDPRTQRYIFMESESGHMGFLPNTPAQQRHVEHILKSHKHPSAELALAGRFGVDGWVEHSPEMQDAPDLVAGVDYAKKNHLPVGTVLLEHAKEGTGENQKAAQAILNNMGELVGNILADYALVYKATGGIYLTGSVNIGLAEYWAENTGMNEAFMRKGTPDHAAWMTGFMEAIPIFLCTDPYVAVAGALALAKEK